MDAPHPATARAPEAAPGDEPYDWLWHLAAIGVVRTDPASDPVCPTILDTLWDALARRFGAQADAPALVALIDVGADDAHPNLARVDPSRGLDLATHPFGARAIDEDGAAERPARHFADLDPQSEPLAGILAQAGAERLLPLVERLRAGVGTTRPRAFHERSLPAHGTAIAGLVVGAPTEGAAYAGVDPVSILAPIRTTFDEDPEALAAALLHAVAIGADVILLPRDLPDPTRSTPTPREPSDPRAKERWDALEALVLAVSTRIPIVCAAGNSGERRLVYPASLAERDGNGVVAVAAATALGRRAGYSCYGPGVTVYAPSDDAEVYNRHQSRFDPSTRRGDPRPASRADVPYSRRTIVATDLPGAWGYAAGERPIDGEGPDEGGLYAGFGGTSAAAAIVAGALALAARAARCAGAPFDGPIAKARLVETARRDGLVPDPMNDDAEADATPRDFFGAGLLDAARLVERIVGPLPRQ